MKLGGITWWRNNYGSILQAYALQKYMREELAQDYVIINQYSKKMISVENLMDKLKSIGIKNTAKRLIGRFGLPKLRKRVEVLQEFVDRHLIVSCEVYDEDAMHKANEDYDGFICGSDQIWNPSNTSMDSMYWLKFATIDKIKIAYAPSIGISEASSEQKEKIRDNLRTFDAISSREESGTRLINLIMNSNRCKTVLDPTLIVEKSLWDELSKTNPFGNGYIFSYMLKGTKQERKLIEAFAKKRNLRIVTMPFLDAEDIVPYDFCYGDEKLWESGPDDFICAIRYADYVFTDSFHCIIYSCIYHKIFYSFPKKGRMQMSRIEGIQQLLGTGSRIITSNLSVEDIVAFPPIKWDDVDTNISMNREKSRRFLSDAIRKGEKRLHR